MLFFALSLSQLVSKVRVLKTQQFLLFVKFAVHHHLTCDDFVLYMSMIKNVKK